MLLSTESQRVRGRDRKGAYELERESDVPYDWLVMPAVGD